ncbi:hypothetical protein KIW84_023529 [Lathyrus oleraceus]|uniref:Uncharacterized protein n=1 Tax=Pisum sativum TaxID=3888 RepID=A0A9D5B6K8_PEA|nr:hypothetical protein KIW84_023529 [Pisum sativum]
MVEPTSSVNNFFVHTNAIDNLEVIDDSKLVHDYTEEVHFNDEFAQNSDDEEVKADRVDDDVQVGSQNVEDEVQVGSKNVENEVQVGSESVDPDYVGSEDDLDSVSDAEYEHIDEIDDMDWTTVLPSYKLVDNVNNYDVDDDSDLLHTPPASDDDGEHERFPAYKSGEVYKFQLGMMFNNKDMVGDALKGSNNHNYVRRGQALFD